VLVLRRTPKIAEYPARMNQHPVDRLWSIARGYRLDRVDATERARRDRDVVVRRPDLPCSRRWARRRAADGVRLPAARGAMSAEPVDPATAWSFVALGVV
jgi:hypothetical protein